MKSLNDIREEFATHFKDSPDELEWMMTEIERIARQRYLLGFLVAFSSITTGLIIGHFL